MLTLLPIDMLCWIILFLDGDEVAALWNASILFRPAIQRLFPVDAGRPDTTNHPLIHIVAQSTAKHAMARIGPFLSHPHVDPSANHNALIALACERGFADVVRTLLRDRRVDPSRNGGFCNIWRASVQGRADIVELLLGDERILRSEVEICDALSAASKCGRVEVMKLLLRKTRVSPSWNHNYAIRWAHKNGPKARPEASTRRS